MAEERSFVIEEAFSTGLAPTEKVRRNTQFLREARGVKATELDRLRLPETISDPSDGSFPTDWPFPQYFRTKDLLIQARETALYSVNETTGALTQMKTYTFSDPSVESTSNYDFSTGVTDPTGWALTTGSWGTEWTYNATLDTITHVAGNTASVTQVAGSQTVPIVAGRLYRIRVIVTAISGGNFTIKLGTATTAVISTTGTHTIELAAAGALPAVTITPQSATAVTITSLSVMEIAEVAIPSGGRSWHFASFDKLFVLANEEAFIFYSPRWNWRPVVNTTISIKTVCNHGDRMFLAGFNAGDSHYATEFWQDVFNEWLQVATDNIVVHEDLTLSENMSFWSKGGGGATDWPFTLEMILFGLMDSAFQEDAKINLKDQMRKGEAGFLIHPFKGAIKRVLSMGDRVMHYGERGVATAVPRQDGMGYDMVPLINIGVADRSTANGDSQQHRMIAEDGQLWRFSQGEIKPEDYRYLLLPMLSGTEVVVNFDNYNGDTYICNSTVGYLRSPSGMTEIVILPTSLLTSAEGLAGAVLDLTDADPTLADILIQTEEFDMQVPAAIKVLRHIIFAVQDLDNATQRILYRNSISPDYDSTEDVLLSADGWAVPNLAAQAFCIELTGTPGDDFRLDQIDARWILAGKHTVRGQYGAP